MNVQAPRRTAHARFTERGFTLIELLVGLAIAVILLVLAAPTYVAWISDSQITNAASTVADGVRFAQAEAIKRNASVEFTVASGEWHVNVQGESDKLRAAALAEGGQHATVAGTPVTSTTVTFNAFGQILPANANAPTDPLTSIDVTMSSGTRPMRVLIGNGAGGSGIKVCDPSFSSSDPKGCPA